MKRNVKNVLRFTGLLGLFGLIFSMLIAASGHQYTRRLYPEPMINIDYKLGNRFLEERDIKNLVFNYVIQLDTTSTVSKLDLLNIEERIEESPFVRNAEAYTDMQGRLCLDVEQKEPLVRVINKDGVSYYLSDFGDVIPLTVKFTSRVPVVTGWVAKKPENEEDRLRNQSLMKLVERLKKDLILWSMVEQIDVSKQGEFRLVSKLGYHKITLGNLDNLDDKLSKLKLWYKQSVRVEDWRKYKEIDLRYQDQVVCKKH